MTSSSLASLIFASSLFCLTNQPTAGQTAKLCLHAWIDFFLFVVIPGKGQGERCKERKAPTSRVDGQMGTLANKPNMAVHAVAAATLALLAADQLADAQRRGAFKCFYFCVNGSHEVLLIDVNRPKGPGPGTESNRPLQRAVIKNKRAELVRMRVRVSLSVQPQRV